MPTFKTSHTLLVRLLAVAGGGFLGGALRYEILLRGSEFGWHGTSPILTEVTLSRALDLRLLLINTVGVFLATWLLLGPMGNSSPDAPGRLFWTTGILGGLTTYSSLIGEIGAIWSQNKAVAVQVGVISIIAAGVAGLLAYRIRRQPGRGSQ